MISGLCGLVETKNENTVIINVNGVYYEALMSELCLKKIPPKLERIFIWTRLIPSDNALTLYGFLTQTDRELFGLLLTVNGVGPKVALNVLGAAPLERIVSAISQEKPQLFPKVSRLGPKTIQRIILELKNKIQDIAPNIVGGKGQASVTLENDLALQALLELGYTTSEANDALTDVKSKELGQRVREALKNLSSRIITSNK